MHVLIRYFLTNNNKLASKQTNIFIGKNVETKPNQTNQNEVFI